MDLMKREILKIDFSSSFYNGRIQKEPNVVGGIPYPCLIFCEAHSDTRFEP